MNDTKPCHGCDGQIVRAPRASSRVWASRKFCSTSCQWGWQSQTYRKAMPVVVQELPDGMTEPQRNWRDRAACHGASPTAFDVPDRREPDLDERLKATAQELCASCPVRASCAIEADRERYLGLWSGVYRYSSGGRYVREPLIDGALLLPLTNRRSGVRNGWLAS